MNPKKISEYLTHSYDYECYLENEYLTKRK